MSLLRRFVQKVRKNKDEKKVKIGLIVVVSVIVLFVAFMAIKIETKMQKTREALDSQVNVEIDMKQVADGTY